MLTRNSQRHGPIESSPAPRSGPTAAADEMIDPVMPDDAPSRSTGTDSRSMAMPFGMTAAPTSPWQVRSSTSTGNVGANAAAMEKPRNAISPTLEHARPAELIAEAAAQRLRDGHRDQVGRDEPADRGVADIEVVPQARAAPP